MRCDGTNRAAEMKGFDESLEAGQPRAPGRSPAPPTQRHRPRPGNNASPLPERRPAIASLPLWTVCAFCLVYVAMGLVGHDPWKADEAYTFGLIWHVMKSGDWVVPALAGQPFVEKPPIFFITAALAGKLASPWIAAHDGARLASGLYTALTLLFTSLAARALWGRGHGRIAALTLCGCLGLVIQAHMMLTDLALTAGCAIAIYGMATLQRRPVFPGVWLGLGYGIAFLAKGLYVPGALTVVVALLLGMSPRWRTPEVKRNLLVAALIAVPFLAIWPAALYLRSPRLFNEWFWVNNIGRFLGTSVATLGAKEERYFLFKTLPWFAFPALPLALLAIWQIRQKSSRGDPVVAILLTAATLLGVLFVSASARSVYLLPTLPALAAIGAGAAVRLPSRLRGIWVASGLLYAICALLLVTWIWIAIAGSPNPTIAMLLGLPLHYVPQQALPRLAFVVVLLAALASWLIVSDGGPRFVQSWAVGVLGIWIVLAMLWMPWIDLAKSYRNVLTEVGTKLDATRPCLAIDHVGESERAMIDYILHIEPETFRGAATRCDDLLIQDHPGESPQATRYAGWSTVWTGARRGRHRENLWLMHRGPAPTLVPAPLDKYMSSKWSPGRILP